MTLFFPNSSDGPFNLPATTTLTLEKALTDAFVTTLQGELGNAIIVTAAENFAGFTLPACFVRATREQESIINSAVFQFAVDITLAVQADDSTPQDLEDLWAAVLDVAYDVTGIVGRLNSIDPKRCNVFGVLRDGGVTLQVTDRHFVRGVKLRVHAALLS